MDTFAKIRQWANDRNLILGSEPHKQNTKLSEEHGELSGAIARGNRAGIRDGIGDMVVVLTILAEQYGMEIEACINAAWDEIKDRKGQMVNGVFVKEADLPPKSIADEVAEKQA